MPDVAPRFWAKVAKSDGCWLWTGARASNGYGSFRFADRPCATAAHRAAWELACGPIPHGMHVLHRCDNPPCVRPGHLFLGTAKTNMTDKAIKGRAARRLTETQVRQIRARHAYGESGYQLAREFGISRTTVTDIAVKTWRHI